MPRRNSLLLLLLVLNLPLVLVAFAFLSSGQNEIRARVSQQQLGLARSGALAADSFLLHNIATLRTLSVDLNGVDRLPIDEVQRRLASYVSANPRWNGMSLVGSDMKVISGAQPASRGISLADRPYLRQLFASGQPAVSDGLVPSVTQVPSVIVAVPFELSDGSKGALLASVGIGDLGTGLRDLVSTDAGKRFSVIDRTRQRLVQPESAPIAAPLEQLGSLEYLEAARSGEAGVQELDQDGERRLIAYAPVGQFGWVVTASEASDSAFAPARRFLQQGIAVMTVGMLTVGAAGFILGKRLRRSYDEVADARERAEAAIRSRDEFLAIAAHELRNPVAAIKGIAQLMQRRLATGRLTEEHQRSHVADLVASGSHLARLVDDLLNVSRLQNGRIDLKRQTVDLNELVRQAIDEAAPGRTVEVRSVSDIDHVHVDPDRVHQVIVNLVGNAVKYSPQGSSIVVAVTSSPDHVHVAVIDHGIGLPETESERLFAPFGRASNAEAANIPGLGLGLYLSRQLAEAHGGSLTASSAGEGRGSTFTLTLPRTVAEPQPAAREIEVRPVNGVSADRTSIS